MRRLFNLCVLYSYYKLTYIYRERIKSDFKEHWKKKTHKKKSLNQDTLTPSASAVRHKFNTIISSRVHAMLIRKTCPCNVYPLKPHFVCIHNLCFGSKIRKIGIPLHTFFFIKKRGVYGVYVSRTCFHDALCFCQYYLDVTTSQNLSISDCHHHSNYYVHGF